MEHLKKLRLERSMTQLALQIVTGIDQALLSKYENGSQVPTVENLMVLADYFNTSLDYLMGATCMRERYPKRA